MYLSPLKHSFALVFSQTVRNIIGKSFKLALKSKKTQNQIRSELQKAVYFADLDERTNGNLSEKVVICTLNVQINPYRPEVVKSCQAEYLDDLVLTLPPTLTRASI